MRKGIRFAASFGAAGVLTGSILTGVSASVPMAGKELTKTQAKHFTVSGSLQVNDVLRVNKNASVYGVFYAHKSAQVWKGLLVRDGLKADVINDTGPLQAQSATIANALQAGAMTGTSITTTGNGNIGGTLAVTGKVTGNGVDAGANGLTTSGGVNAGNVSVTGGISGATVASTGNLSAGGTLVVQGATTLSGGTTITGNLNLSNASINGLNLSNLNLSGSTLSSLNVGTPSGTTAPLNVSANGRTSNIGVNSSGALTVDSLATNNALTVGTSLAVNGAGGVTANTVQAPATTGGGQGTLTLQGSTLQLNGTVSVANQSDIVLSQASGAASHVLANGDTDVAGKVAVSVGAGAVTSQGYSASVTFAKAYSNEPAVNLTPTSDLNPGQAGAPKYWVTANTNSNGQYTGFTIHFYPPNAVANAYSASFYYTIIGTGR